MKLHPANLQALLWNFVPNLLARHRCHRATPSDARASRDGALKISSARGTVILGDKLFGLVKQSVCSKSILLSKAQLAGMNALRKTVELIPSLGHNVFVSSMGMRATLDERAKAIVLVSTVKSACDCQCDLNTEAMLAVAVAALTIYDMGKAYDHDVHIRDIAIMGRSSEQGAASVEVRQYDTTPIENGPVIVEPI